MNQKINRFGLRVLLFIGRFRPRTKPDFGSVLIKEILKNGHVIAGIITVKNDPLTRTIKRLNIPVFNLPVVLDQPLVKVKAALHKGKSKAHMVAWLKRLSALNPDVGVVFYGNWIPPDLYNLPKRGFINYHPAPLPELRGVEPDTFAVLEGRKEMWGVVHQVSESYDEGLIVGRTAKIKLTRYMTPIVIWNTLTKYGIYAILKVLNRLYNNRITFKKQTCKPMINASRKRAKKESVIQWNSDTLEMVHRRLLAFCGQDIRIRLKADVDGKRYCIRDLETHHGRFPGNPGETIGEYRGKGRYFGQPIVRAKEGVVVLELGTIIHPESKNPCEKLIYMIPPRRRKPVTDIRIIRKSIDFCRHAKK